MKKIIYIMMLSCFAAGSQSQNIKFQSNVNYQAQELEQNLNTIGDSLILKSEAIIGEIDIFNENYDETIDVNGNESRIDLKKLPVGDFIVRARLGRKHIVMSLKKTANFKNIASANNKSIKANISSNNKRKEITLPQNLSDSKTQEQADYYWVVYEVNSNSGSSKSMRLERKGRVENLIKRNKYEKNTTSGKNNKLYVYEVYDISEFMNQQSKNSDFYLNMSDSRHFNPLPLYYTDKEKDNRDIVAFN